MKEKEAKEESRCAGALATQLQQKVDREALIAAIETELPGVEHYLDLRTGEILPVVRIAMMGESEADALDEIARDHLRLAQKVRAEADCFELVPAIAAEAGFRWMQEFAATVADDPLRAELQQTLRDCTSDCFHAFRRALRDVPDEERERWFAFRSEKIEEFINAWLEGVGK